MDRYLGFRILIQTETFEESVTFFKGFFGNFQNHNYEEISRRSLILVITLSR